MVFREVSMRLSGLSTTLQIFRHHCKINRLDICVLIPQARGSFKSLKRRMNNSNGDARISTNH